MFKGLLGKFYKELAFWSLKKLTKKEKIIVFWKDVDDSCAAWEVSAHDELEAMWLTKEFISKAKTQKLKELVEGK